MSQKPTDKDWWPGLGYGYRVVCVMCGKVTVKKMPTATTCTTRCRAALSRWVKAKAERPSIPPCQTHTGFCLIKPSDRKRPRKGPPGR